MQLAVSAVSSEVALEHAGQHLQRSLLSSCSTGLQEESREPHAEASCENGQSVAADYAQIARSAMQRACGIGCCRLAGLAHQLREEGPAHAAGCTSWRCHGSGEQACVCVCVCVCACVCVCVCACVCVCVCVCVCGCHAAVHCRAGCVSWLRPWATHRTRCRSSTWPAPRARAPRRPSSPRLWSPAATKSAPTAGKRALACPMPGARTLRRLAC